MMNTRDSSDDEEQPPPASVTSQSIAIHDAAFANSGGSGEEEDDNGSPPGSDYEQSYILSAPESDAVSVPSSSRFGTSGNESSSHFGTSGHEASGNESSFHLREPMSENVYGWEEVSIRYVNNLSKN